MINREELGQLVRKIWVDFCKEIGDTKSSHIAPWEELNENDKEVDRRIGEEIAKFTIKNIMDRLSDIADNIADEEDIKYNQKDKVVELSNTLEELDKSWKQEQAEGMKKVMINSAREMTATPKEPLINYEKFVKYLIRKLNPKDIWDKAEQMTDKEIIEWYKDWEEKEAHGKAVPKSESVADGKDLIAEYSRESDMDEDKENLNDSLPAPKAEPNCNA